MNKRDRLNALLPPSIRCVDAPAGVDPKRLWLHVSASATGEEIARAGQLRDGIQAEPELDAPVDRRDAENAELRARIAALENRALETVSAPSKG